MKVLPILFFATLLFIPPLDSDAYIIESISHRLNVQPVICIWDSPYTLNAKQAVNTWHRALVDNFGEGFGLEGMVVKNHDMDVSGCTINIIYILERDVLIEDLNYGISTKKTGQMWKSKHHDEVFLFIFEARKDQSDEAITRTTMHELGHAFGLGHVMPESAGEGMKPYPDALMWAWSGHSKSLEIDEQTLLAFKCFNNGKSWEANDNNGCTQYRADYSKE